MNVAQLIDMLQDMVKENEDVAWMPVISDGCRPLDDAFVDEQYVGWVLREVVVLY